MITCVACTAHAESHAICNIQGAAHTEHHGPGLRGRVFLSNFLPHCIYMGIAQNNKNSLSSPWDTMPVNPVLAAERRPKRSFYWAARPCSATCGVAIARPWSLAPKKDNSLAPFWAKSDQCLVKSFGAKQGSQGCNLRPPKRRKMFTLASLGLQKACRLAAH